MDKQIYDDEELLWPEISPDWTAEELINQEGMFKFSKVKKILGMRSIELTRLSKKFGDKTYELYGFFKPQNSQYVVRMTRFRHTYEMLNAVDRPASGKVVFLRALPKSVTTANDLSRLKGVYRYSEIVKFQPFKTMDDAIRKKVIEQHDSDQARKNLGVWHLKAQHHLCVELPRFYEWFYKNVWSKNEEG